MNKKLLIVLILGILVLSGCTSNAEITIGTDDTAKEKYTLLEDNKVIFDASMIKDEYIENLLGFYDYVDLSSYNTERLYYEDTTGIKYSKEYKNICELINNSTFAMYFEKKECKKNLDSYEISLTKKSVDTKEELPEAYGPVSLSIKLPDLAIENNADKVDDRVYTWNFNDTKTKTLHLKIKRNKKSDLKLDAKNNKSLIGIILGGVILVIIALVVIKNKKTKKEVK